MGNASYAVTGTTVDATVEEKGGGNPHPKVSKYSIVRLSSSSRGWKVPIKTTQPYSLQIVFHESPGLQIPMAW